MLKMLLLKLPKRLKNSSPTTRPIRKRLEQIYIAAKELQVIFPGLKKDVTGRTREMHKDKIYDGFCIVARATGEEYGEEVGGRGGDARDAMQFFSSGVSDSTKNAEDLMNKHAVIGDEIRDKQTETEDQQSGGGDEGCLERVAGPATVQQGGGPAGCVHLCPGQAAGELAEAGHLQRLNC